MRYIKWLVLTPSSIVHFQNDMDQPTTIHWHGLRISDEMDGNPRIQTPVQPGARFTYRFFAREPGSFWYHPHVRANARTMVVSVQGAQYRLVATDGGRLPQPKMVNRLEVAVGQRYELEVLMDRPGTAELLAHITVIDARGQRLIERRPVLQVEISPEVVDEPRWRQWPRLPTAPERLADREETIELDRVADNETGVRWRMNGESDRTSPILTAEEGETVRLRLVNRAGPEHPFHLHAHLGLRL